MRTRTRGARAVLGIFALVIALTGAGCGDTEKDAVGSAGNTESVADPTADSGAGQAATSQGMPAGFPADVPLLDETVVNAVRGEPGGRFAWSVVMQTTRSVEQVTAEVKKDFGAAGYTARQGSEMADLSVLNFSSDAYDVGVTAGRTTDTVTITYVVKDAR